MDPRQILSLNELASEIQNSAVSSLSCPVLSTLNCWLMLNV
jgi:hypothetical protein